MRYKIKQENNRIIVYGKEKDDLIVNGIKAISEYQLDNIDKYRKFIRGFEKIEVNAPDLISLLQKFFNKVLVLSNKNEKVYPKVKILRFSSNVLEAHISGFSFEYLDNKINSLEIDSGLDKTENNFKVELNLN